MEIINVETIISSLMEIGFETVDPVLYTLTLVIINTHPKFKFKNTETSEGFNKYIECRRGVYKIKDGYTLDTDITPPNSNTRYTIRNTLSYNNKLLRLLSMLDFKKIVLKKMQFYGIKNTDDLPPEIFCPKEVKIIKSMQGPSITKNTKIYYKGFPVHRKNSNTENE